jgi:hypothetical protein
VPELVNLLKQTRARTTLFAFKFPDFLHHPFVVKLQPVANIQGKVYRIEYK